MYLICFDVGPSLEHKLDKTAYTWENSKAIELPSFLSKDSPAIIDKTQIIYLFQSTKTIDCTLAK